MLGQKVETGTALLVSILALIVFFGLSYVISTHQIRFVAVNDIFVGEPVSRVHFQGTLIILDTTVPLPKETSKKKQGPI